MSVSQQASGFNYNIPLRYVIKNITSDYASYTVTGSDYNVILNCTPPSGGSFMYLPPAASVGAGFNFWIWNSSNSAANIITVQPNNSELIGIYGGLTIYESGGIQLISNGSNWQTNSGKALNLYAEAGGTTRAAATGEGSVALGRSANGLGSDSVARGYSSTSLGADSFALGNNAYAVSAGSYAIGYNARTNRSYSLALGFYGSTNAIGKTSFGAASNAISSSAIGQWGILSLFAATTSNTATALTSDGSAASSNNQLILPNNTAISFSILVVARQKAANGTASAAWQVTGLIRREATAATTTLVGTPTVTAISNVPAWTLAVTADTTNGALSVKGTGAASTNIQWLATVYSSEMTYA